MNDSERYYKWLGIPPNEQPPNHYRLLGLTLFESDPVVVESAADARMGHLRTYRTSQHIDAAERMLNEVAAAKICLLKPDRKAQYDAMLWASMNRPSAPPTFPANPPAPLAPPMPPHELPQQRQSEFDASDFTASIVDVPFRSAGSMQARKVINPVVVIGPICGIALVVLIIVFKNLDSTDDTAPIRPSDRRPVAEKAIPTVRTPDLTQLRKARPNPEKEIGTLHPLRRPNVVPVSATGVFYQVAEQRNAAYSVIDQFSHWSGAVLSQASAEIGLLDQGKLELENRIDRQLAIVAKWPAKVVSPIVLNFDEDETKIKIPIDVTIPAGTVLYISAWTDTKPAARKIVLQETPDPIAVTFEATLFQSKPGLVAIHVSPTIGAGTNSIPCNLNRLATMSDSLPGQIQDAQDKLNGVLNDISQAEANYNNIVSQNVGPVGANPIAAIDQKTKAAAAESRLRMLHGMEATLTRKGMRWTTQLQELPDLIKAVKGYAGTTFQFTVYFLANKHKVVLLETGGG